MPVKRVRLLGAESTGKTTLAKRLAHKFDTVWVREFGRAWSYPKDARGDVWTTADFIHIAQRQDEIEDEAAREAHEILFCDTDALSTALWHEKYLGRRSPEVEAIAATRHYDLTFLCAADFPWVNDGHRTSDEVRQRMQRRFEEELATATEPVVELRGSIEERMEMALETIERVLGLAPPDEGD